MGLGLHGGAVAVVKWLLKEGAMVTVTDVKSEKQLQKSLQLIKKFPRANTVKYTLGGHQEADFVAQDLVIQNPGVPKESSYLKIAKKNKIPILNEAVLFFQIFKGQSIAVTGTRGKSSTASILAAIVKRKYKNSVLAGNIAKTPMLQVADKLAKNSHPVLELSSWQLEGLDQYRISPHWAIVTNVMIDHLNRYKSFAEYKEAKYFITKHQNKKDFVVLNADNKHTLSFAKRSKAQKYFFSLNKKVKGTYLKNGEIYFFDGQKNNLVMSIDKIKIPGEHNLANILAAVCMAKLLKISDDDIVKAVNNFSGIDYRLQLERVINGCKIYNDSTATTPDAAVAAIKALAPQKMVLLAGGVDKELDFKEMAQVIKKHVSQLVLLDGSASEKLFKELQKIKYPKQKISARQKSLKTAWQRAWVLAQKNKANAILFSPAGASFNMFENEFDRARQFSNLVKEANGQKS